MNRTVSPNLDNTSFHVPGKVWFLGAQQSRGIRPVHPDLPPVPFIPESIAMNGYQSSRPANRRFGILYKGCSWEPWAVINLGKSRSISQYKAPGRPGPGFNLYQHGTITPWNPGQNAIITPFNNARGGEGGRTDIQPGTFYTITKELTANLKLVPGTGYKMIHSGNYRFSLVTEE